MLTHITISNYAIIDQLELEFSDGLTVLTGETGAGKSILLGALGLVLGDRADSDNVKQDSKQADIAAEFDINKLPAVTAWLVEQELNADNECILRRRVTQDGRSRAYINGTPVNLQIMRELGEMLIDIHGQHEHQSMMKPAIQRQLLDDYADHNELLEKVSNLYVQHKLIREQLDHLEQSTTEKNDRVDLLRFHTQELEALSLSDNEYARLNEQHARLANAEKLISTVQLALQRLDTDDNSNIQSDLSHVMSAVQNIAEHDNDLSEITELLNNALVHIEESISRLYIYLDSLDTDPAQLETVEQRLQDIIDLARKHRVEPDKLPEVEQQLTQELHDIDHADEKLEQLRKECETLEQQYQAAAQTLSESRKKSAKQLNKKITEAMQTLGMTGGRFEIILMQRDSNHYSPHGLDKIEFDVSANAGQACKPLARVASGGELARISLAIQMMIAKQGRIPTMVFDEVDSGVGGGIAEVVGQHLRTLGNSNQVICITHLPQVASQSHHHMRVQKQASKKQTQTTVNALNDDERVAEIARMLSGVEITQQSLAHAEEMISRAQES